MQKVRETSVYARVQPEHKTRIVSAWKSLGAVTAMTGDGVNDAPSIKSADIGIGMEITGTDVTKNVADMVLADDNFATIVLAVKEGRRIYENIRKAIQFLLASNMSEVLDVFAAAMLGFTLLNPVHLLFINLITDCFPALALGMEKAEPNSMRRSPRSAKEGFFSGGLLVDIFYQGILVSALTILSYLIGHCFESGGLLAAHRLVPARDDDGVSDRVHVRDIPFLQPPFAKKIRFQPAGAEQDFVGRHDRLADPDDRFARDPVFGQCFRLHPGRLDGIRNRPQPGLFDSRCGGC